MLQFRYRLTQHSYLDYPDGGYFHPVEIRAAHFFDGASIHHLLE